MRRPADRHDPADLRRRVGVRGLRRREPALLSRAARLQQLLDLSDEELLAALDASPLELLSGEVERSPALPVLLDLLAEAEERAGAAVLRRWARVQGPDGRPVDLLVARDYAAFEDALATLAERGFVIRR